MWKLFISLLLIWLGHGNAFAESPDKKINQLMHEKELAVQKKDEQKYLSVLDIRDPFYIQEQKRWFQDTIRTIDSRTFRLKVTDIKRTRKDERMVSVKQTYERFGRKYEIHYPLRFKKTEHGWKDSDLPFEEMRNQNVVVKYDHPKLKHEAEQALKTIKSVDSQMRKRYSHSPHPIQVKLYHNPEWFRQSIKPSLPNWVGGWNESGESIKLLATTFHSAFLRAGIIHELTHQIVSLLSRDNAAYWLQEGAAMYYENLFTNGKKNISLSKHSLYPLKTLEKLRLEKLPDSEATKYYLSCYSLFSAMVNQLGETKVRRLFQELRQFPSIDKESDQKIERNNDRTQKAFQKVMGISLDKFDTSL